MPWWGGKRTHLEGQRPAPHFQVLSSPHYVILGRYLPSSGPQCPLINWGGAGARPVNSFGRGDFQVGRLSSLDSDWGSWRYSRGLPRGTLPWERPCEPPVAQGLSGFGDLGRWNGSWASTSRPDPLPLTFPMFLLLYESSRFINTLWIRTTFSGRAEPSSSSAMVGAAPVAKEKASLWLPRLRDPLPGLPGAAPRGRGLGCWEGRSGGWGGATGSRAPWALTHLGSRVGVPSQFYLPARRVPLGRVRPLFLFFFIGDSGNVPVPT